MKDTYQALLGIILRDYVFFHKKTLKTCPRVSGSVPSWYLVYPDNLESSTRQETTTPKRERPYERTKEDFEHIGGLRVVVKTVASAGRVAAPPFWI